MNVVPESSIRDARAREAATTIPVYGQLPFVPDHTSGCDIVASDGKRILDLYGGHAVAALGYGHPRLLAAIREQSETMLFQSNAVALDVRASAAEKLVKIAPDGLDSVFFVNSGAEANENALRMACAVTGRPRVLAITGGFHGRTAAAGAVTWKSERWYGFPRRPFDVDFISRDDCDAARAMIGPDVAAVIFEPVQGVAGAFDLSGDFVRALREETSKHGALLIADEVQSGVGRCGHYYAIQAHDVSPDILTSAKALGGGIPCGAVLCRKEIADQFGVGDLGTTFGGGPVAAGAIIAVLETIEAENLLQNVRDRETQLHASCVAGPVEKIQGMGLLLGLVCKQPAVAVRDALLERGILAGTSADPHVLRILAPLVITAKHVEQLATALASIDCAQD
jgi:acetylornithine/succinyldiaminopimelate/putrescine aminotransferase